LTRAAALALALAACAPPPAAAPTCPPCQCTCPQGQVAAGPSPAPAGALAELVESASRKMMHDDGAGCLADLDRIAAADPKQDRRLAMTRAQCEMLVGQCQTGKQRVARYMVQETAMHPERATQTAESIAAMRCRGGDSSERDRLLRALQELSTGAYMEPFAPTRCRGALDEARALIPKVQPRDADDTQVSGGAQALFNTAANCFARAGDCASAWAAYRDLFPRANLESVKDPAQREKILRQSFDGSIQRCAGKP
jgi:hypothetical protein